VLLVERNSPLASAGQLWQRDKITDPLICLPSNEAVCKNFLDHLNRLRVEWFPSIEASSADLVELYVACGLGIGLTVAVPGKPFSPKVRVLGLDGFKPVSLGILWRGRRTALLDAFFKAIEKMAGELASGKSPVSIC
jgi:DNA-binding transcriptional LysR family regulator